MRALLDTHTLLWWWEDNPRLAPNIRRLLVRGENEIFVSPTSLWEIARKVGIGKLSAAIPVDAMEATVRSDGFLPLPISLTHGVRAGAYSIAHRDPFDRLLAAQAELEGLTLLTRDPAFAAFPCATLWE